ncbi:hypothetical protein DFS33DRAFT_1277202 [Desarmillaria ectypa]|nr:hypothetical protein DFS33DRAFT_1277202 [Desarmillaria ectypa]
MNLNIANPGGSEYAPKNLQNVSAVPAIGSPAGTLPHWADFYQLPVENNILAGTEWIYFLWAVLRCTTPSSYRASRELDETSSGLASRLYISEAHIRTKTLHTGYDVLECQEYLQGVCPALINDILREIQTCDSEKMCKAAGPILEHKMWTLQKNLNLGNHAGFLDCFFRVLLALAFVCPLSAFALTIFGIALDSGFMNFVIFVLSFCPLLATMTQSRLASNVSSYACKIVSQVDTMDTDAFKLILAWQAALLILAELVSGLLRFASTTTSALFPQNTSSGEIKGLRFDSILQTTIYQFILGIRAYSISQRSHHIKIFLGAFTVLITVLEWFTNGKCVAPSIL